MKRKNLRGAFRACHTFFCCVLGSRRSLRVTLMGNIITGIHFYYKMRLGSHQTTTTRQIKVTAVYTRNDTFSQILCIYFGCDNCAASKLQEKGWGGIYKQTGPLL